MLKVHFIIALNICILSFLYIFIEAYGQVHILRCSELQDVASTAAGAPEAFCLEQRWILQAALERSTPHPRPPPLRVSKQKQAARAVSHAARPAAAQQRQEAAPHIWFSSGTSPSPWPPPWLPWAPRSSSPSTTSTRGGYGPRRRSTARSRRWGEPLPYVLNLDIISLLLQLAMKRVRKVERWMTVMMRMVRKKRRMMLPVTCQWCGDEEGGCC